MSGFTVSIVVCVHTGENKEKVPEDSSSEGRPNSTPEDSSSNGRPNATLVTTATPEDFDFVPFDPMGML